MTFPDPIRLLQRPGPEANDRESVDPFSRFSSNTHPLRAYLARLEMGGQVLVPQFTILMEQNEYPGSRTSGVRAPINNLQVERIWREGFRRHQKIESKHVSRSEVRAIPAACGEGEVPRHSPLAWCRKTDAYVTPLCPTCLGVMGTCRDEVLLRTSGLPSYERTLSRFLYCRTCCADKKRPPVFYTISVQKMDRLAEGVQLRRGSELYRDLGPRILSAEVPAGTATAAQHACFKCEHRTSCYPVGRQAGEQLPAEDQLFPLAYYDFSWLPLEPLPLGFYEIAALLGGSFLSDPAAAEADSRASSALRDNVLTALDDASNQFFFAGDTTGLYLLESLYLKLSAVADTARGAQDVLEKTGSAHLALAPDRLRGSLALGPSILPVRWGLSLKIADLLTTAFPVELEADRVPGEPAVGSFPYPNQKALLPEGMQRPQIENLWMRLAIEDFRTETSGGKHKAHLKGSLTAPDLYRASEHGQHDLVRVVLAIGPAGGQRVVLAGKKSKNVAGGFTFSGSTGPLAEDVYATLGASDLPPSSNVEVLIAHAFAAPADVMSLGLLMLRLLLTNDSQDLNHLNAGQVGGLAKIVAGDLAAPGLTTPDLATPSLADRERLRPAFDNAGIDTNPTAILHRLVDRQGTDAALPVGLWEDTLLLALRMASNLPGWSICGTQDDYDAADPAAPLRNVVQELDELRERARGSLIGSSGLNAIVQEVCDDFLADLNEARPPDAAMPSELSLDQTLVSPPKRGPR